MPGDTTDTGVTWFPGEPSGTDPFLRPDRLPVSNEVLLPDPGAVWQSTYAYLVGDRILVDDGVWEQHYDGISGVSEPDWGSGFQVWDDDIRWNYLGNVGLVAIAALPGGLSQFAVTTPALLAEDDIIRLGAHNTDGEAHDTEIVEAIATHNGGAGSHQIYAGAIPVNINGLAAPVGSLYLFGGAGVGAVYIKFAAGDTDWKQLQTL